MEMQIVEFTGLEQLEQLKDMLNDIIELADYNVRIAIDSDGFKVSIDRGTWTPGYPRERA